MLTEQGYQSVDYVLLFDVLEHIADKDKLISEIFRVLKPNRQLILTVPFLYPLHDEPRDFIRLTRYGLEQLATRHKLNAIDISAIGTPAETSALLSNLAASKMCLNWIEQKQILSLLTICLPIFVLLNNLLARLFRRFCLEDHSMPNGYQAIFTKTV